MIKRKMMLWWGRVLLFVCLSSFTPVQSSLVEDSFNLCSRASTCDECISASYSCAWCGAPDYEYYRCNLNDTHQTHGCAAEYLYSPPSTVDIPIDLPVGGAQKDGSRGDFTVNLQPQRVDIKLRPGDTVKFNVTVYVSKNYPVDLYYLVDNTFSMKDDFKNLAALSSQLIKEMVALTQNFYLGLGTFNDKPLKPWVFTDFYTKKPKALCDDCAIPDVFRHQLSLSDISNDEFARKLNDVKFSATIEDTEATLEAMLQVVACPDVIGWREKTKHILLVSTESIAHFSGDGVFSGLFHEHDGECHTDKDGFYSGFDKFDFPSMETLYYKMKDSRVQTVFAIPEHRKKYYEEIVKVLPSSIVAVMAENSEDVVEVVVDSFKKIAKLVQLSYIDLPSEDLIVNYTAFCPQGTKKGVDFCEDVDFDSTVVFEVSVTAPLKKSFYNSFSIAQDSLEHWSNLRVNVESIAEGGCECDDVNLYPPDTLGDTCSNNGRRICGGCVCNSGFTGDFCQCSINSPVNISSCQSPDLGLSLTCSDRGTCFCDGCKCILPPLSAEIIVSLHSSAPRVFGQYCQCDNWSCRKHNGLVCGGVDRGLCEFCDTNGPSCKCKPEYTGKACECPISTDTCLAQSSGLICNGEGDCVCGECRCYPNSRFRGDTCEQCFNCPNIHCEPNEDCVICAYEYRDELVNDNETRVCEHVCKGVDIYILEEPTEAEGREQCIAEDDDDCSYVFYYFPPYSLISNQSESMILNANSSVILWNETTGYFYYKRARIEITKKYCDDDLALFLIIIFIILAILLIGASLLVVWKIVVTIKDRREFADFQKKLNTANVKRNENPLFVKPTQTFKNPSHENTEAKRRSMRFR